MSTENRVLLIITDDRLARLYEVDTSTGKKEYHASAEIKSFSLCFNLQGGDTVTVMPTTVGGDIELPWDDEQTQGFLKLIKEQGVYS